MIVLIILAAIIAPNQKYLVLFIVGTVISIVGLVGIIMFLVELNKFSKHKANMNIDNQADSEVRIS
ncbi:hypothetical protein [Mycoplasmopsis agalactiae]|uniref:hypothetical protein n=1 Tax=Mycoplasmopsis agalactiae TaxID=2110 RepID=UPI00030FE505|nr:hypothetical protein [Mycoplasmopsis agalactiae]